ncbi:MAG: amidohydrolase family protein [Acidimicrobiales bacterium]|nr:amidohydrolase family protein [Acidimicrobiales bacterium]
MTTTPTVDAPYASGTRILDADSHVMELPGWLEEHAESGVRDRIRPLYLGGAGALADEAIADAEKRAGSAEAAAELEGQILTAKGWHALGAFDPAERSRSLDLLGFESQLVFPTFAATQFLGDDHDLVLGGTRALNRAMNAFCADDDRLVPVASVPWLDPADTLALTEHALDDGAGAVLLPSHPGKGISPTHPDHDALWSTLEERGVPFMIHIGGGGRTLKPAFHDNGRPVKDFLGGGENIRGKDYMVIHQQPEQFLAALVLDGIFQDHPGLMGGCIEQGAMWVVPWLRRLDLCQATFGRGEPTMGELPMKPSEYVHRNLFFTPFPREPVGWMIEECGSDLFLFSSDYPHPEGTKDPIQRFEDEMDGVSADAREKFYSTNYATMMGLE